MSGRAAWFGSSMRLWATADGANGHRHPFRCPGAAYYGLSGNPIRRSGSGRRMSSVRDHGRPAWVAHGRNLSAVRRSSLRSFHPTLEATVSDLLYISLTIIVFAALFLLIKGVEGFER